MIISRRTVFSLKKGTVLERNCGIIILTSDYDAFHNGYDYHDMDINDDGDIVELDTGGTLTVFDIIGSVVVDEG